MNLLTNRTFGNLIIDVFEEDNDFYMSRKQLNDALEYRDEKSLHRIISRNRDVIGEGISTTVSQTEGARIVTRDVELFSFRQIFQILRFSKSLKANAFMEFTALTMEQLLTNKAELSFKKEEYRQDYLSEVKNILARCRAFGITKTQAAVMIQEAKVNNLDPEVVMVEELKKRQRAELDKKRNRITQRVQYIGANLANHNFEEIWHQLSADLRFAIGVDMQAIRARKKKSIEKAKAEGKTIPELPTYLDLIEQNNAFKEAEKALTKLAKALATEQEKEKPTVTTDAAL